MTTKHTDTPEDIVDPAEPETLTPEVVTHARRLPAVDDKAEIMEWVRKGHARINTNPEAIQERIIANILRAESPDDVLGDNAVESADDVLGELLEVQHFDLNKSDHEQGIGFYAVMDCVVAKDGRRTSVQCGAPQVVLQLMKLEELGAFPVVCSIVELAPGKEGRHAPLGLRLPGRADKVSRTVDRAGKEVDF